jgi:hypothetical protein
MRMYRAGSSRAPPSPSRIGMPERSHRVRDDRKHPRWQRRERRGKLRAAAVLCVCQCTPLAREHHGDEHLEPLHADASRNQRWPLLRSCASAAWRARMRACLRLCVWPTRGPASLASAHRAVVGTLRRIRNKGVRWSHMGLTAQLVRFGGGAPALAKTPAQHKDRHVSRRARHRPRHRRVAPASSARRRRTRATGLRRACRAPCGALCGARRMLCKGM